MVDEQTTFVLRTLRRAGVPVADLDDEIQRTFMVAAAKIDCVREGSERSYLFQVAHNVAWHARRKLARRREIPDERPPEGVEATATPENLADRKEMREILDRIIASIQEPLRGVFVLYELDQMSTAEIARQLRVPRGTVASRLRRARDQFRNHVVAMEMAADLDTEGAARIPGPALLREEKGSALERALLAAGTLAPPSSKTHAQTLAVFGFE